MLSEGSANCGVLGLHVLSLANEFEEERYGGAGTAVTGMLHMLDRRGVRQTLVVPRTGRNIPQWEYKGQHLRMLGIPRNPDYFGRLGLVNTDAILSEFAYLKEAYDLIHIHAINFAPLAYTLAGGKIPVLYSVYSFLRQELGDSGEPELQEQFRIQDDLLLRCQKIHLVSSSEASYLHRVFPQYLAKVSILPLGIFSPQQNRPENHCGRFLYVGRLVEYKGIEDLIKAVFLVKQTGRPVYLDIVGKGGESYERHLKHLVQSMGLGQQIRFLGWKKPGTEVTRWMARALALVVPSRREAYGLTALEGMAAGVPLIVSKAGGLEELADSSCALTFEAGNVPKLVQALITALENPEHLRRLAQRARTRALALEWNHLAPGYLELYREVGRQKNVL